MKLFVQNIGEVNKMSNETKCSHMMENQFTDLTEIAIKSKICNLENTNCTYQFRIDGENFCWSRSNKKLFANQIFEYFQDMKMGQIGDIVAKYYLSLK